MLVNIEKLDKTIKECSKKGKKKVDIVEVLLELGLSARDIYYESEAIFIMENLSIFMDEDKADIVYDMLEESNGLETSIVDEIVDFTTNYESPVEHEVFLDDARNIIDHYIRIYRK